MKQLTMLALAFSVACSGSKDDSAAGDTAAADDTTDTSDTSDTTDTTDTTDTSDTSVDADIWGCNAAGWGLCYDMWLDDGWDAASAEATCAAVASTYGITTDFINDNYGCPVDNAVGECELPASGDFANPVVAWYDAGSFDATSAEGACTGAGGSFIGN